MISIPVNDLKSLDSYYPNYYFVFPQNKTKTKTKTPLKFIYRKVKRACHIAIDTL
jgi:hypothetical protein